MFNILDIQSDIYACLSAHTAVSIYFYPPQKTAKTYIQINSVKISEGSGIAAVEVNIEIKSASKSSYDCLQAMDLICDLYQSGKIKFKRFAVNNIGGLDRVLTINQEQKWVGEVSLYFWLELVN